MGRHSAPEDDEGDVVVAPPPVAVRPRPGRHAQSEHDEPAESGATLEKPAPKPGPREIDEPVSEPDVVPLAEQATERIAMLDDVLEPVTSEAAEYPTEPLAHAGKHERRIGKGNQSTAADLELLRERSDVRARVIAALVVPFVLYTVVLYLAAAMDVYFIWVWIPLVTAGVLAGSILDAAHRRRGAGGTTRS
jgi:hypothetical protein